MFDSSESPIKHGPEGLTARPELLQRLEDFLEALDRVDFCFEHRATCEVHGLFDFHQLDRLLFDVRDLNRRANR